MNENEKNNLHPRNAHRKRYDFQELIKALPDLRPFVGINEYRDESIDFANPAALKTLNKAMLKHFYKINFWETPDDYLCPPVPGRADYIITLPIYLQRSTMTQFQAVVKLKA